MIAYFDKKSAGRLRNQRRQRGRVKAMFFLILLAGMFLGAKAGYRYLLRKGLVIIKQVEISGNQIVATSSIHEVTCKLKGRVMWRGGYSSLANNMMQKYPAIKRAEFMVWPWGKVDINIIERKPLARMRHDQMLLIDNEGILFTPDSIAGIKARKEKIKLPFLNIIDSNTNGRWRALRLIESAPWLENDWVFDAGNENDIKLWLPGNVAVHFGNGSFKTEWQKLGDVLKRMEQENVTTSEIDLRFNGQAVLKGSRSPGDSIGIEQV
jgi:cell division septal protein FtsQ